MRGLSPNETDTPIIFGDFRCIVSEEVLLKFMQECYDEGSGIRFIGSGWSWNPVVEAAEGAHNCIFTGHRMTTKVTFDIPNKLASVPGGMMIADFLKIVKRENVQLEWAPKGFCFLPNESQCFAGFIATNVHHHNTPTAYEYVNSAMVAVYLDGVTSIVQASRTEHSELFESLFGGMGMSGIIVSVELRLRPPTFYSNVEMRGTFEHTFAIGQLLSLVASKPDPKGIGLSTLGQFRILSMTPEQFPGQEVIWSKRRTPSLSIKFKMLRALIFQNSRGFVKGLFGLIVQVSPPQGRNLPYFVAGNSLLGRSGAAGFVNKLPLKKGSVAMQADLDISLNIRLDEYSMFTQILVEALERGPPFFMGARFVPVCGGGIISVNAESDILAVEFNSLINTEATCWFDALITRLGKAGLCVRLHPGKSPMKHPVCREALTIRQRHRWNAVMEKYDAKKLFDAGRVKLSDMFSLEANGA